MKNKLELPKINHVTKSSTVWCEEVIKLFDDVIFLIDTGSQEMTKDQQEVWKKFRKKMIQFPYDLLLAEKNIEEIRRRLKI